MEQELQQKTKTVCPVSFIGNKCVEDDNINGLFTNPYKCKMISDKLSSMMIEDISKNKNINENDYRDWRLDINRTNNSANNNILHFYILSNIADLVKNILIKFIEDVFIDERLKKYFNNREESNISESKFSGPMFDLSIDGINIYDVVNKAYNATVNVYSLTDVLKSKMTIQMLYVLIDMKMSSLYPELIYSVFDRFIVNHVDKAFIHGTLDQLYLILYNKCYNEDPKELPSAQVEYSFCLSIMREIMNDRLIDFRNGLCLIGKNFALMVNDLCNSATDNNIYIDYKLLSKNNTSEDETICF